MVVGKWTYEVAKWDEGAGAGAAIDGTTGGLLLRRTHDQLAKRSLVCREDKLASPCHPLTLRNTIDVAHVRLSTGALPVGRG